MNKFSEKSSVKILISLLSLAFLGLISHLLLNFFISIIYGIGINEAKLFMVENPFLMNIARVCIFFVLLVFLNLIKDIFKLAGSNVGISEIFIVGACLVVSLIFTFFIFYGVRKAVGRIDLNLLMLIAISLVGINVVVYYLASDISRQNQERLERKNLEIQMKSKRDIYHSLSSNYERQRKNVHEFKNKLQTIGMMVRTRSMKGLKPTS